MRVNQINSLCPYALPLHVQKVLNNFANLIFNLLLKSWYNCQLYHQSHHLHDSLYQHQIFILIIIAIIAMIIIIIFMMSAVPVIEKTNSNILCRLFNSFLLYLTVTVTTTICEHPKFLIFHVFVLVWLCSWASCWYIDS